MGILCTEKEENSARLEEILAAGLHKQAARICIMLAAELAQQLIEKIRSFRSLEHTKQLTGQRVIIRQIMR